MWKYGNVFYYCVLMCLLWFFNSLCKVYVTHRSLSRLFAGRRALAGLKEGRGTVKEGRGTRGMWWFEDVMIWEWKNVKDSRIQEFKVSKIQRYSWLRLASAALCEYSLRTLRLSLLHHKGNIKLQSRMQSVTPDHPRPTTPAPAGEESDDLIGQQWQKNTLPA